MTVPLGNSASDTAIRPGFDVLIAVTSARQSATATARRVAATGDANGDSANGNERRRLLTQGRLKPGLAPTAVARFADIAPVPAAVVADGDEMATEMNGPFTRAFQPMVKHRDVNPSDKAGRLGGTGPGMK